jgi:uncharacterized protein (UPF0332 family)
MLTSERIRQAEKSISFYLAGGLLKRQKEPNNLAIGVLSRNADESLACADLLHKSRTSSLWVIVCSYYAMYYISKAVLAKRGLKIGGDVSHKVTADCVIVYLRKELAESITEDFISLREDAIELSGQKADEIISSLDEEREKRATFQYSLSELAMQSKANTSLSRAKGYLTELKKLLL